MIQQSNLPPPVAKPRRSRLAMASLLLVGSPGCALLLFAVCHSLKLNNTVASVVFLVAAAGFLVSPVLAFVALFAIGRSRGQLIGRGMAITSLGVAVFMVTLFFVPVTDVHSPSDFVKCAGNLKQICTALQIYYRDTDNRYPPSLSCLYPKHISDLSLFQCPSVGAPRMRGEFDEQLCSFRYIYYPDDSARTFDVNWMIVAFDKSANHHMKGINVVFVDGHIQFMPREKLVSVLSEMVSNEDLSAPTRDSVRKTLAEVLAEDPVKHESR